MKTDNTLSTPPINRARTKESRITIIVEPINSCLDVQVTLLNSSRTSFRKFFILSNMALYKKTLSLSTGLEGFEPPTSGFGDRRSSH